jgi:hypothetical protein
MQGSDIEATGSYRDTPFTGQLVIKRRTGDDAPARSRANVDTIDDRGVHTSLLCRSQLPEQLYSHPKET